MREWLRRIAYLCRLRRHDAELAEEIEFHRAMKERELAEGGLAPAEARQAARRALGNDLLARDRARDVWLPPTLADLTQDLRFAARMLMKERAFTAVAVVALGLGIGVNTTLFTIVNAFCLRGLPLDRPDRLVHVSTQNAAMRDAGLSHPEFLDLRAAAGGAADFAAFAAAPMAVRDEGRAAERVQGVYVSAGGFRILGEAPVLGRDFRLEDEGAGAPLVAIIGYGLWHSRYGGSPAAIGRPIVVNGVPASVAGVMREGFAFPNNAEVWLPLPAMPGIAGQQRTERTLGVFGRLRDGVEIAHARAEVEAIGQRLKQDHPEASAGIRFVTVRINERYVQSLTHPAWMAFAMTGVLVALIACANVANLLLSRALIRAREIAIRASLGATRRRVVRQLLVESLLLALLGGVLGFVLSLGGVRFMATSIPPAVMPFWLDFSPDWRVFTGLAVVCLGAAVVAGLVPALQVSRTDVTAVLRDAGRGATAGAPARRWTAVFLTAEFALTMILLTGVAANVTSFRARQRAERIFDPAPLLTMMVSLPAERYHTAADRAAFYESLTARLERVAALPAAAVASALPLGGGPRRDVTIEGRPAPSERTPLSVRTVAVGDDYFRALGLQLVEGRPFEARDGMPGREAAIVNRRFVEIHLSSEPAIGRRISLAAAARGGEPRWLTIVGVSPSVRQTPLLEPEAVVYVPVRFEPPATAAVIARVRGEPLALAPLLRDEVRALDVDLPIYQVRAMPQALAELEWNPRVAAWMITGIALIALALSVVGLYAVTAHAVERRTVEIGVRMALGATPRAVRGLVLRRALWQLAIGVAVGVACTYAWAFVFGYGVWTEPINVAVAALLAGVAIPACLIPATRAARLDPIVALRAE